MSDRTRMALADGLIVERFGSGTHVTITYSRDSAGAMVAQSIQRGAAPNDSFL